MTNHTPRLRAVILALVWAGSFPAFSATNGVIFISTRANQDTQYAGEFVSDERGPGMATLGDVAMASLLHDHGYTCRILLDKLLGPAAADIGQDAAVFMQPVNPEMAPRLIILSGSSGSTDVPPPNTNGIPIMMGEHVTLGDRTDRQGSIRMYTGSDSSDPNETTGPDGASRYMRLVAPNHPILQGIPLDSQGRVKIFRERYPEENLHLPPGGKPNYEYRWCTQAAAAKAPGTTILGLWDGDTNRACFAVMDIGGVDAGGGIAAERRVHIFINENGSGGSRRGFLALTEWGRVLFVRAVKWAMGETLEPYPGLQIQEASLPSPGRLTVAWQGSTNRTYQLFGTTTLASPTWSPVLNELTGIDGRMTRTLDVSAIAQPLFLRLQASP